MDELAIPVAMERRPTSTPFAAARYVGAVRRLLRRVQFSPREISAMVHGYCPHCGSDRLTERGGVDKDALKHATHMATHALHNPLWLLPAGALAVARVVNPKTFICQVCKGVCQD
jgi:hypothetical protein